MLQLHNHRLDSSELQKRILLHVRNLQEKQQRLLRRRRNLHQTHLPE
jgi:hypothetical protein